MLLTRNSFCKGTHFSVILLSLEVGDTFFLSFINSLTALRFRFPLSSGGAPWMACRGPKRKASGVVWLHLTYATGSSKSRESPLSASELCRRPLVSFRLWPIARAPWGKKHGRNALPLVFWHLRVERAMISTPRLGLCMAGGVVFVMSYFILSYSLIS